MPKVSIIVPVYNAENTLKRCVESILNQEYTDFELLLIDDGSKDLSGNICDEYAAKDDRVKVVHAKLLERYYQTIGLRYDLTLNDIKVFAHLSQIRVIRNKKELADYAGISQSSVSRILQKLVHRKMIEISTHKDCIDMNVLADEEPILKELQNAFMDYDYVRFQGLSDDERSQYHYYQNRIKENLNRVLK